MFGAFAAVAALVVALCAPAGCATDGEHHQVLHVVGTWVDGEEDAFADVVKPFERSTGITVQYEGSRDVDTLLSARVQKGDPPDLAALSSPGDLIDYARHGDAKPLDGVPELASSDRDYAADWLTLGQVDGHRVAVVVKAALKSLVWYDPANLRAQGVAVPRTWQQLVDASTSAPGLPGSAGWCLGLASSSTSGWPGTDWIEDILLARYGTDVYDRWVAGQLPWTSPEVTDAWRTWGQLLDREHAVRGGRQGALLTSYDANGPRLVGDPAQCRFEHQASFAAGWYTSPPVGGVPGLDVDFAPFPEFPESPRVAQAPQAREVAGDVVAMFRDSPAARKLVAYLASEPAQARWVAHGALSANRAVPVSAYPNDPVTRRLGEELAQASTVRFDGSDRMPAQMRDAFLRAVLTFVANPGALNGILQDLDRVRATAYPSTPTTMSAPTTASAPAAAAAPG